VRVGFTLGQVTRDGVSEPAAIEPISNGVRVRIGDADKLLEHGQHRYVIRYRTTRQIGRFADYDELYWNATGTGWAFPIDLAEATITLPAAVKLGQRAVYTGAQGSTASNAEVVEEAAGRIAFRTRGTLQPHEGLTVAVAWPKGVIGDADEGSRMGWWLADYGPPAVGVLALLGLAGFYYVAWKRAGRNPRPGTVVPLFAPPDDLSPAAMRYVWKMGADNRAFAAARARSCPNGRGGRRLAVDQQDAARAIVLHRPPARRRASDARKPREQRRINRHGAEESREILSREEGVG
jgi:hypothetical protein